MTRGNTAWENKWQMEGRGSGLSRGGRALRGCKDGRGRQRKKMRCINQPVQTKRASQGWTTNKATSNNKYDDDHK
jgi:hypothetical protein